MIIIFSFIHKHTYLYLSYTQIAASMQALLERDNFTVLASESFIFDPSDAINRVKVLNRHWRGVGGGGGQNWSVKINRGVGHKLVHSTFPYSPWNVVRKKK